MTQPNSKTSDFLPALVPVEGVAAPGAGLDALLAAFLGSLDVSSGSRAAYRRNLRPFLRWVAEGWQGRSVSRETVLAYKQHLRDGGYAAATISNYLSALKLLFKWADRVGLAPNIAADVTGARQSRNHRKDALTEAQVVRLLTSLPKETILEKRDFSLIKLLVFCGLRSIEVVRANVDDIRTRGNETLLYVHGKGRDEADEFVVLTGETLTPIMQYLGMRTAASSGDPLFAKEHRSGASARLSTRTIRRIVKMALRRIDLNSPRLSAHSLRHTAVTLALNAGASVYEASHMVRHKQISTTQIYLHKMKRIENAAEKKIAAYMKEQLDGEET